jgi:ketosteroid isomerase-like protein
MASATAEAHSRLGGNIMILKAGTLRSTNMRLRLTTLVALIALVVAACGATTSSTRTTSDTLLAFLDRMDAAQHDLQNGSAVAYKELWSHADDVTLIGGFGGAIENGWPAVSRRLDWAATQFSRGTNSIERIQVHASGSLGYVVQLERIRFVVPGQIEESDRPYRVTVVCRREAGEWRIVHRHADAQTTRQPVRQ